jgi:sortase A
MAAGSMMLAWVAWPIISFIVLSNGLFVSTISPLQDPSAQIASKTISPVVLAASAPIAADTAQLDFTNANIWFPASPQKRVVTPVNSYTLTIKKLNIRNATVVIGGDDLSKSLIHYGGTALPGQYGSSVIFGHSTLPQFFSPTNYTSIFSTLPTLEVGDEMMITYDGITYRYEVYEMIVTDPTDLSPLEQRFDDSYVTLITCVPPGTYWKRLNVKARLMSL